MTDKVSATDPATKVIATVAMGEKAWGTHDRPSSSRTSRAR